MTRQRLLNALGERHVQELLGWTDAQRKDLAAVRQESIKKHNRLKLMSTDRKERQENDTAMTAIKQDTDAAVLAILTPRQRETWSGLTAERTLPSEPPALPALTDAEAARIRLDELSPVFRVLAADGERFGLSDEQQRLLDDLEQVTRLGVFWIRHSSGKGPGAEAEFLKHAEQVALLGILTEQQAGQVTEPRP